MHVGIDLGATRLHCVALDASGAVAQTRVCRPSELEVTLRWLRGASTIAIDAPAALSTAPHHSDTTLSDKFRSARCAEISLGRQRRVWVSWATPDALPVSPWIDLGFTLFSRIAAQQQSAIEVYPHAGYRKLNEWRSLPSKSTRDGLAERARLLRQNGVSEPHIEMWSHDGLDAALAALVALRFSRGEAESFTCGHDGSAIWLP